MTKNYERLNEFSKRLSTYFGEQETCLLINHMRDCEECGNTFAECLVDDMQWAMEWLIGALERREEELRSTKESIIRLSDEIERWKNASGLGCGGDPDVVTPEAEQKYWDEVENISFPWMEDI